MTTVTTMTTATTTPSARRAPRPIRNPHTVHHLVVSADDIGADGVLGWGTVLQWLGDIAQATAARWSRRRCVLVSVGDFALPQPIHAGDAITLYASIVWTRADRMHVLVACTTACDGMAQTAQCTMEFATVSGHAVPEWTPLTMLELQHYRQARRRAQIRRRIEETMHALDCTGTSAPGHPGRILRSIETATRRVVTECVGPQPVRADLVAVQFLRPVSGESVVLAGRVMCDGRGTVYCFLDVTSECDPVPVARAAAVVDVTRAGVPDSGADVRELTALRALAEPYSAVLIAPENPEPFRRPAVGARCVA